MACSATKSLKAETCPGCQSYLKQFYLQHDKHAEPQADDLASLRLPLRSVLAHHLGPRGLKSWEMIGDLGRLKRAGPSAG